MKFANFQANPTPGGAIYGNGQDEIGTFKFEGSFNNNAHKVRFTKQYFGNADHAIFY